jgi:tetratricopeptide (TPR) repeat protein
VKNRFFKKIFSFFLPLVLFSFSVCATGADQSQQPLSPSSPMGQENGKDPFSDFPERYRAKGRENETAGDLPKALKAWKIVRNFLPADEEAEKKIAQLQEQISAAADQHFQKGLAFFESRSYALARNEFLCALYLKPDHGEAIHYLKQKMAGEDIFTYEVKKGDTIKKVARKFYKDPQKDFLIAYFNGLKVDSRLEPPQILRMPILDSPPPKTKSTSAKKVADLNPERAIEIKEILGKARDAYRVKNYPESAALTAKILEYDPANRECRELRNASFYQLGKKLSQEKKYDEAQEAFHRVDSGYKDVSTQLAKNQKHLAEVHYINGVKFFIEEKIEGAIQEWQTTLSLEPKHPKAKKDIENARNLLKKLEKVR